MEKNPFFCELFETKIEKNCDRILKNLPISYEKYAKLASGQSEKNEIC